MVTIVQDRFKDTFNQRLAQQASEALGKPIQQVPGGTGWGGALAALAPAGLQALQGAGQRM